MYINLDELFSYKKDRLFINEDINIDISLLDKSGIKELKNTKINAYLIRECDDSLKLEGNIIGTMVLLDDLTLDLIDYNFDIIVDEILEEEVSKNNQIDLTNIILSLILVEVPLKITNNKIEKKEGNGWRLIT